MVIEDQLIEILPSVSPSHRKVLAVFLSQLCPDVKVLLINDITCNFQNRREINWFHFIAHHAFRTAFKSMCKMVYTLDTHTHKCDVSSVRATLNFLFQFTQMHFNKPKHFC